jgi:YggT family protein
MTYAAIGRTDVADFVGAAFSIYALIVVAWVVAQLVFSLGVAVPYARWSNAVLDFLRDCAEPYLRIFRRLGLRIGAFDLSPIVALIVLQVVAAVVVGAIDPG